MTNDQNLFTQELSSSIHYGFIDANQFTSGIYSPKLILNKSEIGQYVLIDIQEELDKCLSFCFFSRFYFQSWDSNVKITTRRFS